MENDCCVCGNWFEKSDLELLERDLVSLEVQRRCLNSTLNEIYLCRQCKGSCTVCKKMIPSVQKQKFSVCRKCEDGMKPIKKKK